MPDCFLTRLTMFSNRIYRIYFVQRPYKTHYKANNILEGSLTLALNHYIYGIEICKLDYVIECANPNANNFEKNHGIDKVELLLYFLLLSLS